jgi:vancomycin permeability regulator SanA
MDKNKLKKILFYCFLCFGIILFILFLVNLYVVLVTKDRIISSDKINKDDKFDAIVVLGAGIRKDTPSPLLKDRLDKAIELYNMGVAPKIIMSGDHGQEHYDEVSVMKKYAIENGIPSEDIFMDHAGFSTYDTMYRAKNVFGIKKALLVSQRYHLYRSVYIARKLGLDVYGVPAESNKYSGRFFREIREVLARNKDVVKCIFKPKSKYLGEPIDITLNGDITND